MISAPERSRRYPRSAATQPVRSSPSSGAIGRGRWAVPPTRAEIRKAARTEVEWQALARHYSRTVGVARFANAIVADTVARVEPLIELRTPDGDWVPDEEQDWTAALDDYRNELEVAQELYRRHAWHYTVSGEMFSIVTDRERGGVDWWIYGVEAVEPRDEQSADGQQRPWLVKDVPGGTVAKGTAREIDPAQIRRFWIPDEDWIGLATSEMRASVDALKRIERLGRFINATITQRSFAGAFWTPESAHIAPSDDEIDDDEPGPVGTGLSDMDREFIDVVTQAIEDEEELYGMAPLPIHTSGTENVPRWIAMGRDLDPNTITHITEALEDFARGVNLPASLVLGGGPGEGNHWTDWLVDEKFFANAIAPKANRIFHYDLTRSWLPAHLRLRGLPNDGSRRVGYDEAPVVVRPDRSEHSLKLYLAGLLSGDRALEEAGFSPDDYMGVEELARLVAILAKSAPGAPSVETPGGPGSPPPAGPENVEKAPPPPPSPGEAPPLPPPIPNGNRASVRTGAPRRLDPDEAVARIREIRQTLGRTLLVAAEAAMKQALHSAGARVRAKVSNRKPALRASLDAALRADADLSSFLAAVGITEEEAIGAAFVGFGTTAESEILKARRKEQRILARTDAGPDDPADEIAQRTAAGAAAGFLVGALTALARDRMSGAPTETLGEVTGLVPAGIVRDAVRVAEGLATVTLGETPDERPTVTAREGVRSLDEILLGPRETRVRYRWVHGYYGEPDRPFDPHLDLNDAEVDDRDDPAADGYDFASGEEWIDSDLYSPGDHPGCTCEWEAVEPASGELLSAGFASVGGSAPGGNGSG